MADTDIKPYNHWVFRERTNIEEMQEARKSSPTQNLINIGFYRTILAKAYKHWVMVVTPVGRTKNSSPLVSLTSKSVIS